MEDETEIAEILSRIDACVNGDFVGLLGEDQASAWFAFVNDNIMADGVLMEIPFNDDPGAREEGFSIWLPWEITYPDKIKNLGIMLPYEEASNKSKPDEYISWNHFTVKI